MRTRAIILALAAIVAIGSTGCSAETIAPTRPPAAETTSEATPTAPPSLPATAEATVSAPATLPPSQAAPPPARMVFAVIGDYGSGDAHEAAVARLVASWKPKFIVALGDDYYRSAGGTGTGKYDRSTGAFYSAWLKDVTTAGTRRGSARANSFFPALGNHDYSDATPSPATYLTYFRLPGAGYANSSGNERYYDFTIGRVHFFALNSNPGEPAGITSRSTQAQWLKAGLQRSTSPFNVVYDHHPPYSSDNRHGPMTAMQWPFASWGADVVLSGHAHVYERIERSGITYAINGLGGATRYGFDAPVAGSVRRYNSDWGAQKVTVMDTGMVFEFYSARGKLIDRFEVPSK